MYSIKKEKGINYFKTFDYFLFFSVIVLTCLGYLVLNSAVANMQTGTSILRTQLISIFLGIMLSIIMSIMDYTSLKVLSIYIYILSIVLLVMVLKWGTGLEEVGSNSWLKIPGVPFQFQPSELAKIAFVIQVSFLLERIKEKGKWQDVVYLTISILIPLALVLKQPDYGTTFVFAFALIVMLFIFGLNIKVFLVGMGSVIAMVPIAYFFILKEFQIDRFKAFFDPTYALDGAGYHLAKAKLAIGSGRISGYGLFNGAQTQSDGVPIKESDFIFSVIGEELGFLGASLFILIILVILIRCVMIAYRSNDLFGTYVVAGLTGLMTFHFVENIGMNIGLLPVTGIPLPFISAGGSAMITNYLAIGIIISVAARRKKRKLYKA